MITKEAKAKKKVMKLIDRRTVEIIRFIQELIKFKSINPRNANPGEEIQNIECMKWLKKRFQELRVFDKIDFWEEENDMPNLVGVLKGKGKGKSILLNAHADVVKVSEKQLKKWTVHPWSGELRDGNVWGRGALDNKSGCTIIYSTIKSLQEAGIKLKGDVILSIISCEEIAAHELGPKAILEKGYTAPFVMVAEASNLEIHNIAKGLFYFRLTVPGKSTHNSRREKCIYPSSYGNDIPGVNAIEKLFKYITAFSNLEQQWALYNKYPNIKPGSMHISPTIIKGGDYKATIPDWCEIIYGVYFIPGFKGKEVIDEVKKVVDQVTEGDYWLRRNQPKFEAPIIEPLFEPFNTPRDHLGCKTLAQAIKEATNEEAVFGTSNVGDFNLFASMGFPTVVHGARGGGEHGSDEYVTIKSLIECCKSYACMLINWCKIAE